MKRKLLIKKSMARLDRLTFWASSPVAAILLPMAYVGSLFVMGIVLPVYPIPSDSLVYLFGGLAAMAVLARIGISAGQRTVGGKVAASVLKPGPSSRPRLADVRLVYGLAALGIGFLLMDLIASTPFEAFFDPAALRTLLRFRKATLFAYPGNILYPFCSVALGLAILHYERMTFFYRLTGVLLGFFPTIALTIGQAGRNGIVFQIILVSWWLLQRPAWGLPIIPHRIIVRIIFLAFIAVSLYSLVTIAVMRSSSSNQYQSLLSTNAESVRLSDHVKDVLDRVDPTVANGLAEALMYWSSPVVYFGHIYQDWTAESTLVSVFSPVLHRRLASLGVVPSPEQISNLWASILDRVGLWPNAWGTVWYEMIVSFGRFGATMIALGIAFFSGIVFARSRRRGDFGHLYLSSIFFVFFFLWFQVSVFSEPLFEWGLFLAIFGRRLLHRFDREDNLSLMTSHRENQAQKALNPTVA